jgi:hypothetical protein
VPPPYMKTLRFLLVVLAGAVVVYFGLPHLVCLDVPKRDKLANCVTNRVSFTMTCDGSRPYALLLGVPKAYTSAPSFMGEVRIARQTEPTARLSIGSDRMTACSWLDSGPGLKGYILTWSSTTNQADVLSHLLTRGQHYNVEVAFSEAPPPGSSLWLSSMGKARLW